jgi:signal transduction histidine kinase
MLEPELKIALYRIAQEALNNVAKHAAAAQASVLLHCEPARVVLTVCDDGQGFDPASIPPNHLGVGIMRERAQTIGAELTIDSRPGQGTQIRVVWGAPSGSELVTAMG